MKSPISLITLICLIVTVSDTFGSTVTIGPNGINSAGLRDFNGAPLTGVGIAIGQVERHRSGKPDFDTDGVLLNSRVIPEDVFFRHEVATFPPPPPDFTPTADEDTEVEPHAVRVAGVMISTDTSIPDNDGDSPTGVAPGASLFSAGYNPITVLVGNDEAVAITNQHLATLAGTDVRTINMSFALPFTGTIRNGNQLLTQFVDWSAAHHDVLYVIAGNEDSDTNSIPTDNFNGMDIASSVRVDGVYR